MRVIIHGWGQMGKAFALSQTHQTVLINPTPFDRDVPSDRVCDLSNVSVDDIHVMGVSSQGIPWFIEQVSAFESFDLIVLTKGLMAQDGRIGTLTSYLNAMIKMKRCIFVSGPCLASDLMNNRQVSVNFSSNKPIQDIVDLFQTSKYAIVPLEDVVGCQWLAALKNVYAIICAHALAQSITHGAVVFQQSMEEMSLWLKAVGAHEQTAGSLSGVGDLFVTVQGGRNGRFGQNLAKGLTTQEILSGPMKDVTVEGLNVVNLLKGYPEQFDDIINEMPLYKGLLDMLF